MNSFRGEKRYKNKKNKIEKFDLKVFFLKSPIRHSIYFFTSLGFITLVYYFWENQFFPSMNLADLPNLFIIVGGIGFLYFLLVLGSLILPPFLFNVRDAELKNIIHHTDRKIDMELKKYTFFIPLVLFLISFSFIFANLENHLDKFNQMFSYLILGILILGFIIYYFVLKKFSIEYKKMSYKNYLKEIISYKHFKSNYKKIINYLARLFISLILILVTSYFLIFTLLSNTTIKFIKDSDFVLFFYVISFSILFSLFALIKESYKLKVMISLGLLVFIFILSGKTSIVNFSNNLMKNLGLGQIKTETIYIKNKDFCINLGNEICSDNKIDKTATIIWKLGNELFISIEDKDKNISKYIIDKKEINSIKLNIEKEDK